MILGLGLDLAEVPRIARLMSEWGERFLERVFTAAERDYALGRAHAASHLAARFAAKEALLKALRVPPGISWQDIEVVGGGQRAPELSLRGRAAAAAADLGVVRLHLSLTHTDEVAAAVVVAEGTGT